MPDLKIYAKTIESEAQAQVERMAAAPVGEGSKIRIMPDCHAGKGCTIGTTMTITDKVCPNLVGVDIGCGMFAVQLGVNHIDLKAFDATVHEEVPAGFNIHEKPQIGYFQEELDALRCPAIDKDRALRSIGTLGGGNHFIELDRDQDGKIWLVIHSGSRHLGLEIAEWYQKLAQKRMEHLDRAEIDTLIADLRAASRQTEISGAIREVKERYKGQNMADLAFLIGQDMDDYLHDMRIAQDYAAVNRNTIARSIILSLGLFSRDCFQTVHNYIDLEHMILRKGAVAAYAGQRLLIPLNMRDGALLCRGKGNEDWNCSAPHGAGRLYSRSQAKRQFSMEEYRAAMEGIYTTSVTPDTLDEAPFAYKDGQEIMECISPTVEIVSRLTPIYNFKAGGEAPARRDQG